MSRVGVYEEVELLYLLRMLKDVCTGDGYPSLVVILLIYLEPETCSFDTSRVYHPDTKGLAARGVPRAVQTSRIPQTRSVRLYTPSSVHVCSIIADTSRHPDASESADRFALITIAGRSVISLRRVSNHSDSAISTSANFQGLAARS